MRGYLTGILSGSLVRWVSQALNAAACAPERADPKVLADFLALTVHLAPEKISGVFGSGSWFYRDMTPRAVHNLQTYLAVQPAALSWIKKAATASANESKMGYFGPLGPLLANQLGWLNSRFGQRAVHGSSGAHQVSYQDVCADPTSSSLLDCILLIAPPAVTEQFLRLPGAAPALRERLSDDRAGFLMTALLNKCGMILSDLDLFRGWVDPRGNTLAHYLFAFRASRGGFSKTSAVTMARAHADQILVENAVGVTPLGLLPSEFASIVERTLLRKTVRSTPKEHPSSKGPAAPPHRRKM